MSDALEERLASRLQTLADTVDDDLAVPADLELQVQRRHRRSRRTRGWSSLAVAAAVVVVAAGAALVHRGSGHGSVRVESSPSSTTPAPTVDALLPGTVMLSARGTYVISLDATGHTNATEVTSHGTLTYARATADHRVVWYFSEKNGAKACGEVVLLNIAGSTTKIVTKAVTFDVSPDGTRIALYGAGNLADGDCTLVKPGGSGEIAVIDVANWDTSTVRIGNVSSLRWSPDGSYLVATSCGASGCNGLRKIDVPSALGRPLVAQPIPFGFPTPRPVRSVSAAFGPDGLYLLTSTGSGASGRQAVYRYVEPVITAPALVFSGADQWRVTQVIPTAATTYVVAARISVGGPPRTAPIWGLYRIVAGRLVWVRGLDDHPGTLTAVTPLAPGR